MADPPCDVKTFRRRTAEWIDCHPRTGWWLAGLMFVNTILNVLDLLVK